MVKRYPPFVGLHGVEASSLFRVSRRNRPLGLKVPGSGLVLSQFVAPADRIGEGRFDRGASMDPVFSGAASRAWRISQTISCRPMKAIKTAWACSSWLARPFQRAISTSRAVRISLTPSAWVSSTRTPASFPATSSMALTRAVQPVSRIGFWPAPRARAAASIRQDTDRSTSESARRACWRLWASASSTLCGRRRFDVLIDEARRSSRPHTLRPIHPVSCVPGCRVLLQPRDCSRPRLGGALGWGKKRIFRWEWIRGGRHGIDWREGFPSPAPLKHVRRSSETRS